MDADLLPAQATPELFVYYIQDSLPTSIPPNSIIAVHNGISMEIPPGMYGHISPKSVLSLKNVIDIGGGCY